MGRSKRPFINDIPNVTSVTRYSALNANYRLFWKRFRESPELVAVLSTIIIDILGDRPKWTAIDGGPLGRNKRLEAIRFWRSNRGKENIAGMLFDKLLTGDGYIWKGTPEEKEKVRAIRKVLKERYGFNLNDVKMKELISETMDEDYNVATRMQYVASSTMEILTDDHDVLGYKQTVRGGTTKFSTQEMIHFRHMALNGYVRGFTPVEALTSELILLTLVKGNMLAYMQNGGSPDLAFVLPKEMANSKNHQYMVDVLQKFKGVPNMHGNLVLTGEVGIEQLSGTPKDMEYKDLALYIASNIAFVYGLPVTRIPYLIGQSATKGDNGGISDSGYWNRISYQQDDLEDLLNSQLFEPMGWHIEFPRRYKQDEVREAQTASMNADTVQKMQTILAASGKQLKVEKVVQLLDLAEDDLEELDLTLNPATDPAMMGQNQLPNSKVLKEPDAQKKADTKKNSANDKKSGAAATNP